MYSASRTSSGPNSSATAVWWTPRTAAGRPSAWIATYMCDPPAAGVTTRGSPLSRRSGSGGASPVGHSAGGPAVVPVVTSVTSVRSARSSTIAADRAASTTADGVRAAAICRPHTSTASKRSASDSAAAARGSTPAVPCSRSTSSAASRSASLAPASPRSAARRARA